MKEIFKTIAVPFIIGFDYLLKVVIYIHYVLVRIMKAPFTNLMLDSYKFWSGNQPHELEARQSDIFRLYLLLTMPTIWYFFGWFWFLMQLLGYVLIFTVVILFFLPKTQKD